MDWHYLEQGQQIGPITDEQLAQLLQSGKITDDTLVWRAGLDGWNPYRTVKAGNSPRPSEPPPALPAASPGPGEVVCAECGGLFPAAETIRHGNAYVCAGCKPVFLQKLAEGAPINTGALNLAPIGTRFAAVFLDGLILMAVNITINLIAGRSMGQTLGTQPTPAVALQFILIGINTAIGVSYETYMIGKYGATLGKMACKIKVVTADGGPVTYGRAFGRYFAKMVSAFTCMIGYIMAIFDVQKRALHDRMCNTRVVIK